MPDKIKLGDNVKCKFTGFEGTAVARTEYLNGCVQFEVLPHEINEDGKYPDAILVDEQSLVLVKNGDNGTQEDDPPGGPSKLARGYKGY